LNRIAEALTEKEAATAPGAEDPRLRGRTYSITFDRVWEAAITVIRRKLRGWVVVIDDDRAGRIEALATSTFRGIETEVVVSVGLDENGQTRVDVAARTRTERRDWGRSKRLIGRFTRKLDRELAARPEQILDPSLLPRFQESA
jgi:cytochrome c biogenesis protein ResB